MVIPFSFKRISADTVAGNSRPATVCLLAGLGVCQGVALVHLYWANLELIRMASLARALSIPFVPDLQLLADALKPVTLFSAALFITFSLGLALVWGTLFIRRLIQAITTDPRRARVIAWLAWILLIGLFNSRGFSLWNTAYIITVPAAVIRCRPRLTTGRPARGTTVMTGAVILVCIWLFHPFQTDPFTRIRDLTLYRGAPGEAVVRWYYRYAFYPASALAAKDQRPIRIHYHSAGVDEASGKIPPHGDPVTAFGSTAQTFDLHFKQVKDRLSLRQADGRQRDINPSDLPSGSMAALERFARDKDPQAPLRNVAYFGLFLGWPLSAALVLQQWRRWFRRLAVNRPGVERLGAIGIALLTLICLWPHLAYRWQTRFPGELADRLTSDRIVERQAGLDEAVRRRVDLLSFSGWPALLTSSHVPDRIDLARALAHSRNPAAGKILSDLMADEAETVVCQAMRSLSNRESASLEDAVRRHLWTPESWYLQDCAFRSLRDRS